MSITRSSKSDAEPPSPIERINLFLELWLDYEEVCKVIGSSNTSVTTNIGAGGKGANNKHNSRMLIKLAFLRKFYTKADQVSIQRVIPAVLESIEGQEEFKDDFRNILILFNNGEVSYEGMVIHHANSNSPMTAAEVTALAEDLIYGRVLHADWGRHERNETMGGCIFPAVSKWITQMQSYCNQLYLTILNNPHAFKEGIIEPSSGLEMYGMTLEEADAFFQNRIPHNH